MSDDRLDRRDDRPWRSEALVTVWPLAPDRAITRLSSIISSDTGALLAPSLSDSRVIAQVRGVLARGGRVHVPDVFSQPAAQQLYEACRELDWKLVFRGARTNYDFAAKDVSALEVGQKEALLDSIHAQASSGFQYLYDSYRISDFAEAGTLERGPLASFFNALNSDTMLARLRALTGDDRIAYLDAQATRFRPGHFLTAHDDHQPDKHRLYAYVLNLTPVWRADFGGLLMFIGDDGHIAEAYTPRWNALNILRVPQPHAVSVVAPFARGARYSITGCMRSKKPAFARS